MSMMQTDPEQGLMQTLNFFLGGGKEPGGGGGGIFGTV